MRSRYLESLECQFRNATNREERDIAQAEIAAYYARQGETAKASRLLSLVRTDSVAALSGRALAWVNFAEGLVEHIAGRAKEASTKWERARALAGAVESPEVSALASAWLAFSAYLAEDLDSLEREFSTALGTLTAYNAAAVTRLTLTLGLSFHYAGDLGRAIESYRSCKLAANSLGDEVALSALIHDMASMSIAFKRNFQLAPEHQIDTGDSLRTSANTASSFEEMVGVSAAPSLAALLLAQSDILDSNWSGAIQQIQSSLDCAEKDGFGRIQPGLVADRAYCLAKLGQLDSAERDATRAVYLAREADLHGDDRAVLLSRLSKTYELLSQNVEAQRYSSMANEAWSQVADFRGKLLQAASRLHSALSAKGWN